MRQSSQAGTDSEADADAGGRFLWTEKDLVPKESHQQHEEKSRGVGTCQLAVEYGELANGKEGRGQQTGLAVEPLLADDIDQKDGSDAHESEGELYPQLVPADQFGPIIEEYLHTSRMRVAFGDAILDEVMEVVEPQPEKRAELVVHERYLSEFPKTQHRSYKEDYAQ